MNVIVLEAPALHLGYLGCYGSEWAATPALDRLAAEGIVFDQHIADGLDPELRSSWSGRYVYHRATSDGPPAPAGLPALLHAAGVVLRSERLSAVLGSPQGPLTESFTRVFESALATLEQVANVEHSLVWIELPSLAPPWSVTAEELERWFPPPDEEDEDVQPWLDPPTGMVTSLEDEDIARLQITYTAIVSLADTLLAAFLEALAEGGWLTQSTLWLTARTGLPLAEHGVLGTEGSRLHEELVHLPLLVRLPDLGHAGRRIPGLTQPVDLMPTLLETFGIPVPPDVQGRSLWPLIHGKVEEVRPYACAGVRRDDSVEWLLRTPEWGFLLPAETESPPLLYLKPEDRWEVNNLLQHYQPWADHLEQTLRGFVAAAQLPGPLQAPPLQDLASILSNNGGTPS